MTKHDMGKEDKLIQHKDEEGIVSVNTRFADEDVWLSQEQLVTIYQTTQENVSIHISNIYSDTELEKEETYKEFILVRQEGKRHVHRIIDQYNLDVLSPWFIGGSRPLMFAFLYGRRSGCMSISRRDP